MTVQPGVTQGQGERRADEAESDDVGRRLLGEVITEALGVSQVDVTKFGARSGGVDVHQDPDAQRHRAGHVDLAGAQEGNVAETHRRVRRSRGTPRSGPVVVVKMTLTTSSWSRSLRVHHRRAAVLGWRLRSPRACPTSQVVAPRRPRTLCRCHEGIVEAMSSVIPTASMRRRTSASDNCRDEPGVSVASWIGPMRVRTSRVTS